jgi:hypothetical protein
MTPSQAIFVALVTDGMQRAQRAAELVWERTNESVRPILIDDEGQLDAANIDNLPFIAFVWADDDDISSETLAGVEYTLGEMVLMATEVARLAGKADRSKKSGKSRKRRSASTPNGYTD